MNVTKKHSNVFYINRRETGFEPVKQAKAVKNSFGLDLFSHFGLVYEGRTGIRMFTASELPDMAAIIEKNGGIEKMGELIESQIAKTGESPRYTRPDERKTDIFPPDPAKADTVFAKDASGGRHYYHRFYNENGTELYTLKNAKEAYRTIFVECGGYMLGIGQHHNFEDVLKWLEGLGEGGIRGEVEKRFNESMADPQKWADPGFANILGRSDEADAHNAPIREAREREYRQRDAEREAARIAREQTAKAEYDQAIKAAEAKILNKQTVNNGSIHGKSLIMQLFREHDIAVPLKTQGWIGNALHSIEYDKSREKWDYSYYSSSRDSTVFSDYLPLLVAAVRTKQQFEEMNQNCEDEQLSGIAVEEENGEDMEEDYEI